MSSALGFFKFIIFALTITFAFATAAQSLIDSHDVIVFSKSNCPWCVRAKDLLKSLQINFHVVEFDALPNGEGFKLYQEIRTKTGQTTVPNIFIKGKHIGGYDSISKLNENGLLKLYASKSKEEYEL